MITRDDIDIFIMAGGKSVRMGQDKGMMIVGKKPILLHLSDTLLKNGLSFTVIANKDEYKKFGFKIVNDTIPQKGPMGTLFTAFCHSTKKFVMLLVCDTAFVLAKCVSRINPLMSVYPISIKNIVLSCVTNNQLKM